MCENFVNLHIKPLLLSLPGLIIKAYRSFSLSHNKHGTKKNIGNRPVEEAKKMKCYKRLIYKQFVQISGLSGPQFLSYLPKRFTHLCRALYGDALLVYSLRQGLKTAGHAH